jgi:hypothetical protein
MKYLKVLFAVSLLFVFTTCKKENMCDCVKRTGSIINEYREYHDFDKIRVEDNVNVFITQDAKFEVMIEAGKNIVPLIKTEMDGSTLIIRNKNRCNWTRSYKEPLNVYLKMPVLNYITSNSSGKVMGLNTITSPDFQIEANSAGDVELTVNNNSIISHTSSTGDIILHGVTYSHSGDIGGLAFLNCKDLQTTNTYVHSYSTGNCYVSAVNQISCLISQTGDIYCYDHPAVVQKTQVGSGQLFIE